MAFPLHRGPGPLSQFLVDFGTRFQRKEIGWGGEGKVGLSEGYPRWLKIHRSLGAYHDLRLSWKRRNGAFRSL